MHKGIRKIEFRMSYNTLSSASGKISKLLVVFTGDTEELDYIKAMVEELSKRQDAKLLILVGEESLISLINNCSFFKRHDGSYKIIHDSKNVLKNPSRWVRDPFTIVRSGGNIGIIEAGSGETRNEDNQIAEVIQSEINATIFGVRDFPFDGGNILADDDFVLVGANQFSAWLTIVNVNKKYEDIESLIESGKKAFKKALQLDEETKIYVIGTVGSDVLYTGRVDRKSNKFNRELFDSSLWFKKSPKNLFERIIKFIFSTSYIDADIPHIDLFLTVTGLKQNGKHILLLGEVELLSESNGSDEANNKKDEINSYLEEVENYLESIGSFKIIRTPIPLIQLDEEFYFGFYNNCLVENSTKPKECKIWLPFLSSSKSLAMYASELRKVEDRITAIWVSCGISKENFCWIPFSQYKADLEARGSLHCITKDVVRL